MLTANADVANSVVRNELDDPVQLLLVLLALLGVELPQAVEPGKLEELLREEEATDEVRVWAPEGEVTVVDVLHVWLGEHSIFCVSMSTLEVVSNGFKLTLASKVIEERGRSKPPGGRVRETHDCKFEMLVVSSVSAVMKVRGKCI